MRIGKKRLREIIVNDIIESKVLDSASRISLKKGRRHRGISAWTAETIRMYASEHLEKKGFEVSSEIYCSYKFPKDGKVRVKLYSKGRKNTWVAVPKEVAEKIVVFGVVPDFRGK